MKQGKAVATVGLVERSSGIVVPGNLADEPEVHAPTNGKSGPAGPPVESGPAGPPVCYDPDGRRRVVMPRQTQKRVNNLVLELAALGFGLVVVCRVDGKFDGKQSCGEPAINEGRGQPDDGYGCKCTRIHFQG